MHFALLTKKKESLKSFLAYIINHLPSFSDMQANKIFSSNLAESSKLLLTDSELDSPVSSIGWSEDGNALCLGRTSFGDGVKNYKHRRNSFPKLCSDIGLKC